ncbi:MAG: hypothetical protein KGJ09_00675 [Candidatus Omnitrophica bacterium]|nr:hypothetical protein [Candidatus Omnitrophota bacterium]MDE2008574.1 hypothetical protein [Candidatus Omnitrophota bacterium]MDE2214040.1 hypothetical protein [Candidatus Omnitrophota bacterium]MDE2230982.1 hypothetical protein [Candidatus Omnitrophota bacterium]
MQSFRRTGQRRQLLIVGCGALGGALALRLGPCASVTVLDPCPRARVKVPVFHDPAGLRGRSFDGVIVATKCYDAARALAGLKIIGAARRVLFLQNGLLDLPRIAHGLPEAALVRGVTTSAVGNVKGKPVFHYQGRFFLACDRHKQAAGWFCRLLSDAGLKASLVSRSSRITWAKLIFSAVMNPLPVIEGRGYDVLRTDACVWKSVRQAVEEGKAVARALRVRLAFDPLKIIKRVRQGDLKGIAHRGTLFEDRRAGRPTELDYITGALVRQARRQGLKTPALDLILRKARKAGA